VRETFSPLSPRCVSTSPFALPFALRVNGCLNTAWNGKLPDMPSIVKVPSLTKPSGSGGWKLMTPLNVPVWTGSSGLSVGLSSCTTTA